MKRNRRFYPTDMSALHKRLLFMGPGDTAIQKYIRGENPVWAEPFKEQLVIRGGRLYFDNKRMLLKDEKRHAVKRLYFDPKEPTGLQPITDALRQFANVSRGDVSRK